MDIQCPSCHKNYVLPGIDQQPKFCPFCGASSSKQEKSGASFGTGHGTSSEAATLVSGHIPLKENIQFTIGTYQVISSIGKGGMGEVFLAYDITCGRRIALKRIRTDLIEFQQMHNRFLKEARVTSQLTHPAIIPIYAIHQEDKNVYYTMPFVEGLTLRQILKDARQQEKKGMRTDLSAASIPSLVRIFLSVCQAVAYAHSKYVLHRDLKPENIIIGTFGEVLILDWGLAKLMRQEPGAEESFEFSPSNENERHPLSHLTHIGRVVGTVAYMAPERALGQPATFQTDIYSLGVILYQILTLRYPFRRGTLKEFRQNIHKEVLHDPVEVAPYRDVPPMLSSITLKCLTPYMDQRYKSVQELIHDVENFIEGRSEWFKTEDLDIERKSDWEFQENILLAEHFAITRGADAGDWVSLMIAKNSYPENTKIETKVKIGEKGHGLGFLLSIPEQSERVHLNDGYCLWVGSDLSPETKLLRSTVEVVNNTDVFLNREEWYTIRIEKIDNNIYFYLNNILQLTFISHLPLVGTHIGLLSRDADFILTSLKVYRGSQNIRVNCLAVPDAFLAHKEYATALSEYRRIGYSFPGRAEGREAMFRAGVTLLEQATNTKNLDARNDFYELSLEEFGKMHKTPGAPLEYLGKALVYQTQHDYEEEIKCFELVFRRYPHHPLLPVLQEQITYRLHESSRTHRKATYQFMLLVIRNIPQITTNVNIVKLFKSLQKHWEPLYFIEENGDCKADLELKNLHFAIQLAFWLARPYVLDEIIQDKIPLVELCNAIFGLIELGSIDLAENILTKIKSKSEFEMEQKAAINLLQTTIDIHRKPIKEIAMTVLDSIKNEAGFSQIRNLIHLMITANDTGKTQVVFDLQHPLESIDIEENSRILIDCQIIWAYLLNKNWGEAGDLLHRYSLELLSQETTPLHFLYGCWLSVTEGKEIANIHFTGVLEVSYPRSWTYFSHYLIHMQENVDNAFMWERRNFYSQMHLYYLCQGEDKKAAHYRELQNKEYISVA